MKHSERQTLLRTLELIHLAAWLAHGAHQLARWVWSLFI
jgi:hypothetical protein